MWGSAGGVEAQVEVKRCVRLPKGYSVEAAISSVPAGLEVRAARQKQSQKRLCD